MKKGKRIYSILSQKCPRCHEGDLFVEGPYSRQFSKMPDRCPVCNLPYHPEPSFYTGAMYVSYALQVAMFTTVYVVLRVLFNPPAEAYIVTFLIAVVLLLPVTLRLSRAIYINFFCRYDHQASLRNRDGSH
ncbi:MAG: DUF983 domain-containing protein [Cyclobacteriaceae bacterium]